MKLNLQYFAQKPSGAVSPSSTSAQQGSQATSNSSSSAQSSSVKTYTQSEVDQIAKETAGDQQSKLKAEYGDKLAKAVAHQKKLDNMNADELRKEMKKERQDKMNKILAENKQFKQKAKLNKAMKATDEMLADAKVPNSNVLTNLVMDIDPKARTKKVQTIVKYLKDYRDTIKTQVLKGKSEPQTGNGITGSLTTHKNNGKPENPFVVALKQQQQKK